MSWPKIGAIHYHEQLELPDKDNVRNQIVGYMLGLPNLLLWMFGQKRRD